MDVARQAVELCDDERCPPASTFSQSGHELRSVGFATALDFDVFGENYSPVGHVSTDSFPLRFHAQSEDALLVRRNSQIATKISHTSSLNARLGEVQEAKDSV